MYNQNFLSDGSRELDVVSLVSGLIWWIKKRWLRSSSLMIITGEHQQISYVYSSDTVIWATERALWLQEMFIFG